jgi:septum site-determining protein MinC
MKEPVVIKSYQMNGFKLVMDPTVTFEEILDALAERLKRNKKFFKEIPKGLLFEGRTLSFEEQKKILSCIRENSDMNIVCVMEEDQELQEKINAEVQKACLDLEQKKKEAGLSAETKPEQKENKDKKPAQKTNRPQVNVKTVEARLTKEMSKNDPGLFYKGSLRSGQVLESDQSIVLLGDVNPGANVISKGNVIVLGKLRGNVFAGADGNKQAFVVALDMQPVQVRIDDCIARAPDQPEKEKVKQAKIAFLEGENIYIEPVSREVFNDIHV